MGHEISQFDIPDRQLMTSSAQARMWSDIGEAKITRTIFGRARIRVVREKDKAIRTWLIAALVAVVLAVVAWQGWVALQQSKLLAATPPLSERISVSAPVFHPEIINPATTRSASRGKPESLIQTEIDSMLSNPNARPARPSSMIATESVPGKPLAAQPLVASKPQTPSSSTNIGSLPNATNAQPHSKSSSTTQTTTPAHTAAPAVVAPPAASPAASKPAPVATPAEPLSKKDTAKPSSAGNDQPADQASAQPQANARGTPIIFEQPDSTKP